MPHTYDIDIEDTVKEVRECDRKILRWFNSHDVLSPGDYVKIHRPGLVKVRLYVMSRLGIVEFDDKNNAHLTRLVKVDDLPINSDRIRFRTPMVEVVYNVIKSYRPRSISELGDILTNIFGRRFYYHSIQTWIKNLKKIGLVEKSERYTPTYDLFTEDNETLFKEWMIKTKRLRELGQKMAPILQKKRMKKHQQLILSDDDFEFVKVLELPKRRGVWCRCVFRKEGSIKREYMV